MTMGLVSKQTAMEARGYDAEQEQERMAAETANTQTAGGLLLRDFFKTGGASAIQKQKAESMVANQ